jgi:hypothetical protein
VNDCASCVQPRDKDRTFPRDTIPLGNELAWISVREGGISIDRTLPVPEAITWALDTAAGLVTLVTQATRPDDVEFFHESIADSVWSMPIDGGARQLRYATSAPGSGRLLERIHGVATGFGRLYLSRSWRLPAHVTVGPIPIGTPLQGDIVQVLADGSLRVVAPTLSWRWGRLRLAPDGRSLLAEALDRTSSDIYLIPLEP